MSRFPFKVGDRVRYSGKGARHLELVGIILKDKGVMTPPTSPAPLAAQWPPEQVWEVRFTLGKSDGRDILDTRGCWESDLELVEEAAFVKRGTAITL